MDNGSDPTKLTSFQPLSPVSSPGGFSLVKLFNNFGRRHEASKDIIPEINCEDSSGNEDTVNDGQPEIDRANYSKNQVYSWLSHRQPSGKKPIGVSGNVHEDKTSCALDAPSKEKWRYRNVRTILRRLSAFTIDRRWHQTTGDFKHNFKQYWMPDEHCKECYECNEKFNTFRRRHHCRVCGQIFCYRCCGQEVAGKVIGFTGDIRVCNYCHKIVNAYLSDDMERSIEALSEDIRVCDPNYIPEYGGSTGSLSSIKSALNWDDPKMRIKRSTSTNSLANASSPAERSSTPIQRSPFDAFGVTPTEANTIKQDYLRDLWRQISDPVTGLELLSHRYKLKTYHNCLIGNELCDWLIKLNLASDRHIAINTGQALLENGWIEHVIHTDKMEFKDEYILFQPSKLAFQETETARMRLIMFSGSGETNESDNYVERTTENADDDDEEAPKWFKQLNSVDPLECVDSTGQNIKTVTYGRGFSTGRNLDLDHVITSISGAGSDFTKEEDLSLQMNLDSHQENDDNKMISDQGNKISFITHVPPLPLDTYVCVEGHQTNVKKKITNKSSGTNIPDDILKGVVFPRMNTDAGSAYPEGINDGGKDESGERLARDRLNAAAHHHIHTLMQYILKQNNLYPSWEDVIMPFISKISEKVVPDVGRGDDMDIRRYVWITKVPGGLKTDCHLVSGMVFRKNIAHKRMTSVFSQPKILMMSCAIEYQRVEHKMSSLDPLILQEYAFLQNFVKRVLDVKPNVLLVEKNVARFAQDMLLSGGVTLIHNIKPQVMENIRRCTGAEILQKMEQVTRPRLGSCQHFRAQKYILPTGEAKTLIYLDGCAADLGCSLILRGGNMETLIKVKKFVKYFIYVAYHLKLEAKFLMDEFAMPPPLDKLMPQSALEYSLKDVAKGEIMTTSGEHTENETSNKQRRLSIKMKESERFRHALKTIVLSSSPFCGYSMPYLLTDEGKSCPSRQYIVDEIYSSSYHNDYGHQQAEVVEDDDESEVNESISPNVIVKPLHSFTNPSVLISCIEDKDKTQKILNDFRARGGTVDLKMYHEFEQIELKKVYGELAVRNVSLVSEKVIKSMEDKIQGRDAVVNKLPDPKLDCFNAYNHLKIPVLFSSYSNESDNAPKPCLSPWAVFMEFYGRNDITLGGFLERYCFRPSYICSDHNCDVPMVKHVRYFAHGNGSLYINMRNLDSPIPGYDRTILTWSWCKICQQVTPVMPLSFECWSLSFAKYLELRFYGDEYTRRGSLEPCGHSLHHDHYQYFSFGNMAASFKYRPITLHEIVLPSHTVTIGEERNPQHLMEEVKEVDRKVISATGIIMDKIVELKSDDGNSLTRDSKIKEFLSELQKEQSNLEDCIHVVKKKTEQLLNANSNDPKSSSNSQLADSFEDFDKKLVEMTDIYIDSGDQEIQKCPMKSDIKMNNDEIRLLMADVRNKLFHLKKSLCESVETWNSKLQDFITQDRKKEKNLGRSVSPSKITSAANDNESDMCVDGAALETEVNRPRTVTHMHPEPVSEVFLTDGTILRQTYFGTRPHSGSPFLSDINNLPSEIQSLSHHGKDLNVISPENKDQDLDGDISMQECVKVNNLQSKFRNDSALVTSIHGSTSEAAFNLEKESEHSSAITFHSNNEDIPKLYSKETLHSSTSNSPCNNENILSKSRNEMSSSSSLVIDRIRQQDVDSVASDSEFSLRVQYSSDRDEFSDNQSLESEDIDSNFLESEGYSDAEMAEEENDAVDTIQIGQSAGDFVNHRHSRDTVSKRRRVISTLSGFTEFPKIAEDSAERMYLTPKEAKAMQVQRRLRTEWESRIRIAIDNENMLGSNVPLPHTLETSQQHPLISGNVRKNMPVISNNYQWKGPRNRQSNPLIKRLVETSSDTNDINGKSSSMGILSDMLDSEPSAFMPVKRRTKSMNDDLAVKKKGFGGHAINLELSKDLCTDSKNETLVQSSQPADNNLPMEKRNLLTDQVVTSSQEIKCSQSPSTPAEIDLNNELEVPSEHTQGAPFVFVHPRQEELSKMAEQVCQQERRDAERDIPEVLQYDEDCNCAAHTADSNTEDLIKIVTPTDYIGDMIVGKAKSGLTSTQERSLQKKSSRIDLEGNVADASKTKGGGDKMKKIISNLLTSAAFQPIPRPFPPWEQYMTQVDGSPPIIINEKEPTSLIAFTLSSQDYQDQLRIIQDLMAGKKVKRTFSSTPIASQPSSPCPQRKMDTLSVVDNQLPTTFNTPLSTSKSEALYREKGMTHTPVSWTGSTHDFLDNEPSCFDSTDNLTIDQSGTKQSTPCKDYPLSSTEFDRAVDVIPDADDIASSEDPLEGGTGSVKSGDDNLKKKEEMVSPDYHIKLQFQNNSAKFYCSVYYAEQFRELRQLIFPEGEERFIQSLARCKFWKATGGKSGSSFSKSFDDRFVMKQMSRLEVQSFVDFGPRYFAYINKAVKEKRPTAIAKLLGVYRIGFKNSVTNTTMRQDVLVMENLFYNKKVRKIYDLKGSVRSRYVHTAAKEDVLMDENFLETICDSPLFIRPHGKAVLSKAIFNDTEFLSTNMVMDYSLLVGIDEVNLHLIVGIIDYIRTYTWDKKLESYVKSTGILGGQGKMPTVVSPDVYRMRFTAAMTQHYFLMVPDKWTGFGEDIKLRDHS